MEVKIITSDSEGKKIAFEFKIYKSEKPEDQQIESDFYIKHGLNHKVHEGVHYEMELISPDLKSDKNFEKFHTHPSIKTNKDYVCWTPPVQSPAAVLEVLQMWCAGVVYAMKNEKDFAYLFGIHNVGQFELSKMTEVIKKEYGISIYEVIAEME